jgi:hypothetical protein
VLLFYFRAADAVGLIVEMLDEAVGLFSWGIGSLVKRSLCISVGDARQIHSLKFIRIAPLSHFSALFGLNYSPLTDAFSASMSIVR